MDPRYTVQCVSSLSSVSGEAWDAMVDDSSPFMSYAWLRGMETAGCVCPEQGWRPLHLLAYRGGELIAALPLYMKGNSFGEFVYDWSWADFAHRNQISYYPKLIVASPFSPVTGRRLLASPELGADEASSVREALLRAAIKMAREMGMSGLHVLFPGPEELPTLERAGLFVRTAFQYHWHNDGYRTFDDFLGQLRSKRRMTIRRERRLVHEAGYRVTTSLASSWSDDDVDALYGYYASTCARYAWGRRYLSRAFFDTVRTELPQNARAYFAWDASGERVAGTLNLEGGGRMYGRYWGSTRDVPNLHFETCYYAMIEDAIARGVAAIEPGAGGEHKVARGFVPTKTYSAHWIRDPRLRMALEEHTARECRFVDEELEHIQEMGPYRALRAPGPQDEQS